MPQPATESQLPTHTPKYRRLTDQQEALILQLARANKTQVEIAQIIGCHQTSVGRVLDAFTDTTADAIAYSRGQSLRTVKNLARKADKGSVTAANTILEVAQLVGKRESVGGLTIIIGGDRHDVKVAMFNTPSPQLEPGPSESLEIR